METIILYTLLGLAAGLIAGLFGVGGGLIIVPVLVILFESQEVSSSALVHLAIGTSLATIVVTSISSMRAHHRHGAVRWNIFRDLTPGIVIGALLGAVVADFLPTPVLRVVFGIFELAVAIQIGFNFMASPHRQLPGRLLMSTAGVVIGTVSSVVGIGGGTMTVPFLVWCNVSIREAVATSSACGLPIAIAGATGFVLTGWSEPGLPSGSTGYLYWPAFLGIAAASIFSAPLGAKLTHTLPVEVLRRIFAGLLAVLGVRMLIG
ncbi:MAG TPA: sulfite exporter TauE/SafE family protein [Burkholderiales bacterium]|nr:sulfite exporter TauE/SafE family protein [Burkholderiales bacterium]